MNNYIIRNISKSNDNIINGEMADGYDVVINVNNKDLYLFIYKTFAGGFSYHDGEFVNINNTLSTEIINELKERVSGDLQ